MIHQVIVPRFSRGRNLRPVNSIKHVVDRQSAIVAGTTEDTTLIGANDSPVIANTSEVLTGSRVNSIFLIVEINTTSSAALANAYMLVGKSPGSNVVLPVPNVVGASDAKRHIIHQEMVMLQQQDGSNPRTLFKGVIRLPRGMRRFAASDILQLKVLSPGVNLQYCVQCHYKEYR